jgi:putative acetyltransferase
MSEYQIRRQEPEDAVALHDLYSQPKVIWGTTLMPYPSLHFWKTKVVEEPRGMTRLVACVDEKAIGHIILSTFAPPRRRHAGDIAMAVHDEWQGKGCGFALLSAILDIADNSMDLKRVELQVFTDNERARRLYERCDFEIEGTLRGYAIREGGYADVYAMARLR